MDTNANASPGRPARCQGGSAPGRPDRAPAPASRRRARLVMAAVLTAALLPAPGVGIAQTAVPIRNVDERTAGAFAALEDGAARYCENVADAAADARFQRQAAALRQLEGEIENRIARLEEKRRETEDWLVRREAFLELAEDSLIEIYSAMRPEPASAQLAIMNEVTAAAILTRLNTRAASAILGEMPPDRAARLASIMVGIGTAETIRRTSG